MTRIALLAVPFALLAFPALADEAKGEKIEHETFFEYFEKNNSGLKGDLSLLTFVKQEDFDKVFAARPPLMGGKKAVLIPKDTFDKHFVAAVITRGNSLTTYKLQKVTRDGDTVYVEYKTESSPAGSAKYASPMIITVPKDKVKKVEFIENGKSVGNAEVK